MSDEAAPVAEASDDMDTFMNAAFDELEAAGDDDTDDTPEVAEAEEPDADTDEDSVDEAEEPGEPEKIITAPQSMSAKDREAFDALPPASQKWMTDRAKEQEQAFTQKTMDLADKSKGFDRLEQVLGPRRQQNAMDGMDDSTAVGQLFALSDFARTDPLGFVKYLFNSRGIPLSALNEPGDTQGGYADPQLAAMQQRMQGFENFLTQQQAHSRQQAESAVNVDVQKFAKDNEFYAELESEMIPVVSALRSNNPGLSTADALAKAYKMAIAANDGVSAKVDAAKSAKAEADNLAMAKARAAKAKKAVGPNVRQSGTRPAGPAAGQSVDDFIGALIDERMKA